MRGINKVFEEMKGKQIKEIYRDNTGSEDCILFEMVDGTYYKMAPLIEGVMLLNILGREDDLWRSTVEDIHITTEDDNHMLDLMNLFSSPCDKEGMSEITILVHTNYGRVGYVWRGKTEDLEKGIVDVYPVTIDDIKQEVEEYEKERERKRGKEVKSQDFEARDNYSKNKFELKNEKDNFLPEMRFYDRKEKHMYYGDQVNTPVKNSLEHNVKIGKNGLEVVVSNLESESTKSYKLECDVAIGRPDKNKRPIYNNDIVVISGRVDNIGCVKYNRELSTFVIRAYDEYEDGLYFDIEFNTNQAIHDGDWDVEFEVVGTKYGMSEIKELHEEFKKIV